MTDLHDYTVTWRLPQYDFARSFTIRTETTTSEAAAERMFFVCNGQDEGEDGRRWTAMRHRSLSVGDNVDVNGEPWQCAAVGWERSTELHPKSMEERLRTDFGVEL